MLRFLIFSLLLFSNKIYVNSFSIPIISDIQDVIALATTVQDIFAGNVPFKSLLDPQADPSVLSLKKLDSLSDQVTNLGLDLTNKMDSMVETLMERIPLAQEISAAMRDFHFQITRIDSLFDDFQDFVNDTEGFNKHSLDSFTKSIVSHDAGDLSDVLNQMHGIFVPGRSAALRESLLNLMIKARELSTPQELCNPAFSFQERLYEIFNIISISEIRGFMMTLFSYDLLAAQTQESYVKDVKKATAKFVLRMEEYIMTVRKKISMVSRELYTCDPQAWIEGETYVELKGLMTGYLINEEQAFSSDTCSNTCDEVNSMETYRCMSWSINEFNTVKYCQVKKCLGKAYWCSTLNSNVDVCEYPEDSFKRYKYVTWDDGTFGTTTGGCEGEGLKSSHMKRLRSGFYNCDPCFCRCIETSPESKAIRTISFMPQMSNIAENKVVSNIRFVEKDKIIQLQIEESELLPELRINSDKSSWVPLEDFQYQEGGFVHTQSSVVLVENEDYVFITDQRRGVNLDDIYLPSSYVLTGVRLYHANPNDPISHIEIEAYATPISSFSESKLNPTSNNPSIWITPANQPTPHQRYTEKRTEVDDGDRIDPTKSKRNTHFSKVNEYVMIAPSSVRDDAGQTTVPLFNAQPVTVNRTLALGGIGLFDSSAKNYGGFITPKAFTVNLADYMNVNMHKNQLQNYRKLYREVLAYDPPVIKQ